MGKPHGKPPIFHVQRFEVWNHQPFNRDGESFFQLLASLGIAVVMVRVASWHHAVRGQWKLNEI